MHLEPAAIRNIVRARHPHQLSGSDAAVILELCQLAVDADGREDPDEISMFFAFGAAVNELAGSAAASTPTFASDEDDDQRMHALAAQLASPASRELAYTIAYVLTVADVDIAPEESAFIEKLRAALRVDSDRADDLAAQIAAAITPNG
jgi:hypothetical protein